jgi:hypothetical protein
MQRVSPIASVIDLRRYPPGQPAAVEQMRRYLAATDPLGGYLPQLAMPPRQSELFVHFWFALRRIDDLLDSGVRGVRDALISAFQDGADFALALAYFLDRSPASIEAERRIRSLLRAIALEEKCAATPGLPAELLLHTFYHRAYIPVVIGFGLFFDGEDPDVVQAYSMLVGTALQLTDDLLDLPEDVAAGRFWITDEELRATGARRERWQDAAVQITALREAICLTHHLVAWEVALRLHRPRNRLLAARLLETVFRLHLGGRFTPGGGPGWRSFMRMLADLPGPESVKHTLYNLSINAVAEFGPPLVRIGAIRERVRLGPPIPDALSPATTLRVMRRLEVAGA